MATELVHMNGGLVPLVPSVPIESGAAAVVRFARKCFDANLDLQIENLLLRQVAKTGFSVLRALDARNRVAGRPEGHDDTPLLAEFRQALEAWELSR